MSIPFKAARPENYRVSSRGPSDIRYLVIHFTANDGDSAKNNADYFAREAPGVSAHYFVDEREIWQSVREKDIAWHCGTKGMYFHPYCRNANSLGIELCSRKQGEKYYFTPETVRNAQAFVRTLMQRYGIPAENVVRHYDVTHKNCPAPFVEDAGAWQKFKAGLVSAEQEDEMTEKQVKQLIEQSKTVYDTVESVPAWGRETAEKLTTRGLLRGEDGKLALTEEMLRVFVVLDRAGAFGA